MFNRQCAMCNVPKPRRSESSSVASGSSRTSRIAFTLIELVLVLMLIAITLALAAPSFRGWSQGGKLRDAADQFQAVTLHAQSQSAADAVAYTLTIAGDGRSYQLTPSASPAGIDSPTPEKFNLPDHLTIQIVNVAPGDSSAIRFSSTGSTTPARVRITADWGESVDLVCASAISVFARAKD